MDGFQAGVAGEECVEALNGTLGKGGFYDSAYARGYRRGATALAKATEAARVYADMVACGQTEFA